MGYLRSRRCSDSGDIRRLTDATLRVPHVFMNRPVRRIDQSAAQEAALIRRDMTIMFGGRRLDLLSEGAIWFPDDAALIIADIHLEKGSFFASRGQMLPPYDTALAVRAVQRLAAEFQPELIVSLGDSFHDGLAVSRLHETDRDALNRLTASCDWVWIEGNHDPAPPYGLGGRAAEQFWMRDIVLRHLPSTHSDAPEICGHLHPVARISGRGGRSTRTRCFIADASRIVMPSMGALTGGLNIRDAAFGALFREKPLVAAIGRDGVYAVSCDRLVDDRPTARRSSSRWRL